MKKATRSLCNKKTDETKSMDQLVFTNHLKLCKSDKNKTAIKSFEMIFYE